MFFIFVFWKGIFQFICTSYIFAKKNLIISIDFSFYEKDFFITLQKIVQTVFINKNFKVMLFLQATAAGDPNNIVNSVISWFTTNGLDAVKKIVIGLIILYIGFRIIKFIRKKLAKAFEKRNLVPLRHNWLICFRWPILYISYNWVHIVCGLVWLASFTSWFWGLPIL